MKKRLLIVPFLMAMMTSCSLADLTTPFSHGTYPNSIKISGNDTVVAGSKLTLNATLEPSDATVKVVTWKSSDEKVATVERGVVSALKVGLTTITATAKDSSTTTISDALPVTVTHNPNAAPEKLTPSNYVRSFQVNAAFTWKERT